MPRIRSDNRLPAEYDAGALARLLRLYDDEINRLTGRTGTVTWNPANIANGASDSTTVTVTGVMVGLPYNVRVFAPYSLQGLQVDGYVSANNTVTLTLNNNTGGAVNLGSGVWGVVVEGFVRTT